MQHPSTRSRIAVLAVTVTALVVWAAAAPATTVAATVPVRIEAGVQVGHRFDAAGKVTATTSLTFRNPVNTTASIRRWYAGYGHQLFLTGGPLRGWWVRESRIAYIRGYTGVASFAPSVSVSVPVGRYELYRFDANGVMSGATYRRYPKGAVLHADRRAVIEGRHYVRVTDGSLAGWWLPGTTASPTRIACATPVKPTHTTGRLIRSVPSATGRIALTFDMGGRLTPAMSIVRFLLLERVCTTFFPTADAAKTTEGRAVMALIGAHPELFELGNHSYHHCNLRDGGGAWSGCPSTRPSDAFAAGELTSADATYRYLSGLGSKPYWRPPYGAVDSRLVSVAAAAGYPDAILWSTDTIDWRPVSDGGPTASATIAKVSSGATAGAIVLMHLGGYTTRDALPGMLQTLAAKQYVPTSISGLFAGG
jgi:peptidoglycan/xylan/chitin deacetylase (PgdA/CDA1 family)